MTPPNRRPGRRHKSVTAQPVLFGGTEPDNCECGHSRVDYHDGDRCHYLGCTCGSPVPRPLRRRTAPARRTDPVTSHQAARAPFRRESQRHRLLRVYELKASTDEEAATAAGIYKGCPWKRCSELRELDMIATTGLTRMSTMGSPQQECAITEKGRRTLRLLEGT